jgi:hypothetical protein
MLYLIQTCYNPCAILIHPAEKQHDDAAVLKNLELVSVVTAAMQGNDMRIKADKAASNKADCIHPAYEVCWCFSLLLVRSACVSICSIHLTVCVDICTPMMPKQLNVLSMRSAMHAGR